jgi:hypothetical protein
MDMQEHHWYSTFISTGKWTKALTAIALLVTSTATWAQVDITSDVRQDARDCRSQPITPEIKLLSAPAKQGKNTFEFAGSGSLPSSGKPPLGGTVAVRVTNEVVGGHTTIIKATLGYSPIVNELSRSCFVVDIPLSNPGTNEVRYIAELYDFAGTGALLSTAEARATFNVPIVSQPVPALSAWALLLLGVLACWTGSKRVTKIGARHLLVIATPFFGISTAWAQIVIPDDQVDFSGCIGGTASDPQIIPGPISFPGPTVIRFQGGGRNPAGELPELGNGLNYKRVAINQQGNVTTVTASVWRSVVQNGRFTNCFQAPITLTRGSNTIRFIVQLQPSSSETVLATSEVSTVVDALETQAAPALSTWALTALAILAAFVGARRLRTPNLMNNKS